MAGIDPRPLVLLLHIPRTAGTGMRKFLASHLVVNRHLAHDRLVLGDGAGVGFARAAQFELISGHFPYGLHERFPGRPYRYVTLLREPVERVLSLWRYLKHQPHHRLHSLRAIRGMTPRRFLRGYAAHSLQFLDGQTRQLVGGEALSATRLTEQALRVALERIEEDRFLVGLTNRFEDSARLFARELGIEPRWSVGRQNAATDGAALVADDADIAAIRAANPLDEELYRRALALFRARYDRAFPSQGLDAAAPLEGPGLVAA